MPGWRSDPTQPVFYQLDAAELVRHALRNREGVLTDQGALAIDTGKFTGRSPKDRYIVKDEITAPSVWWGDVNIPMSSEAFGKLHSRLKDYLAARPFYIRDVGVGADIRYRLPVRVITETASQNLFARNVFIEPEPGRAGESGWTVIAAPGFMARPLIDGTRQANFAAISFTEKTVLIGGTGYTGEIKKAMFTVLNFLLPAQGVLPMHCAANIGQGGDTALFFGLSGTGKTTLSADAARPLIGDDEHGWAAETIFNFEGGCYAKTVNLDPDKEPQIYQAIRPGALLENVGFYKGTNAVNFADTQKTENTRVSYPLAHLGHTVSPSIGKAPSHIFF